MALIGAPVVASYSPTVPPVPGLVKPVTHVKVVVRHGECSRSIGPKHNEVGGRRARRNVVFTDRGPIKAVAISKVEVVARGCESAGEVAAGVVSHDEVGVFQGSRGGVVFGNRGGVLPAGVTVARHEEFVTHYRDSCVVGEPGDEVQINHSSRGGVLANRGSTGRPILQREDGISEILDLARERHRHGAGRDDEAGLDQGSCRGVVFANRITAKDGIEIRIRVRVSGHSP